MVDNIGRITISDNDNDELLFKDPPPKEDCPICMLPMPHHSSMCDVYKTYMPCCGKLICDGCVAASVEEITKGNMEPNCAFCRVVLPTNTEESMKRLRRRIEMNDKLALRTLGCAYQKGIRGVPRDIDRALKLLNKAAELGSVEAHFDLANLFWDGDDGRIQKDTNKAVYHYKLAAIGWNEHARLILGAISVDKGNIRTAMKHYMIAAKAGHASPLKQIGFKTA